MAGARIEFHGVSRHAPGAPAPLLANVDLALAAGAVWQLVGPSGAGKTTLLRLVNRLDEVSGGAVRVDGRDVREWAPRDLRQRVGMVFQEPSLLGRSARGTLALPFELSGEIPDPEAIAMACRIAGVETDWLERDAARLSTGQKQRICLARALVRPPDVLLLDEPTAGLDRPNAEALLDRLATLNRDRGTTLLLVTHRLDEVARLGGQLAVMIGGRVAVTGPAAALLADPPAGPVRGFLQGDHPHA